MFKTPVVLCAFNRPDVTAKVFARIREVRPQRLLLVADGPRPETPTDPERCSKVRELISQVDWPAEVRTNFSNHNLGCRQRMSTGLTWVFDQVDEAIILEDDCLPTYGFFRFCEELLDKYREDTRIGIISGNNFVYPDLRTDHSYYFSQYTFIWGWATWRRTWQRYESRLGQLSDAGRPGYLRGYFDQRKVSRFWERTLQRVAAGEIDSWAYPLSLTSFLESWLNVVPGRNSVSNLGFGPDAVHTRDADSWMSQLPTWEPEFPLTHPDALVRWKAADDLAEKHVYNMFPKRKPLRKRLKRSIKKICSHVWNQHLR